MSAQGGGVIRKNKKLPANAFTQIRLRVKTRARFHALRKRHGERAKELGLAGGAPSVDEAMNLLLDLGERALGGGGQ